MRHASLRNARAICDRCGFEYKRAELKMEWTNLLVCCGCYEDKHPQLEPHVGDLGDPYPVDNPRPAEPVEAMNPDDDLSNFFPSTAGQRYTP